MPSWKLAAQSALIGAVAALAFGVIQGAPFLRLRIIGEVDVEGRPAPADFVRIEEGAAYVVPNGKLLVLTSISGGAPGRVRIDGVVEASAWGELPFGLVARPSESVEIVGTGGQLPPVLRGYLGDE